MNVSYLFLAPGFEEIEAIAVVDILRRGGVDVRTVSVGGGNEVTGAHHLKTNRKLRVTCYPGFEKYLPDFEVVADGVVVDGKMITGKGPGFAILFGLAILEQLRSAQVAGEVAAGMLLV